MRLILSRLMIAGLLAVSLPMASRAAGYVDFSVDKSTGVFTMTSTLALPVGAVSLMYQGAGAFTVFNNPNVDIATSGYALDPLGDGRNVLSVVNAAAGISILDPGAQVQLGSFSSLVPFQFQFFPGD